MEQMDQTPSDPKKVPWYFKSGSLVVAFLCAGPFMLPLVWTHPKMTTQRKVLWTVVIAIATYFMVVVTMDTMKKLGETYEQLKSQLPT